MSTKLRTTAQIYDSALKTLLEGQAQSVFRALKLNVTVSNELRKELGQETIRPVLRIDRAYRATLDGKKIILHTEMETRSNKAMLARMLEYCAGLHKKYVLPVLSVVLYPFRTKLPPSTLEMIVGGQPVLTFHCRIIPLWELQAQDFIDRRDMCMYPLLPTMQGATYDLLKSALDELYTWCQRSRKSFGEKLVLFGVFLQRSDMVSTIDKRMLRKELEMYDRLISQSRYVKKARKTGKEEGLAEGEARGEAKGKTQGLLEGMRKIAREAVYECCPILADQVDEKLARIEDPQTLQKAVIALTVACGMGEKQVHKVLETL